MDVRACTNLELTSDSLARTQFFLSRWHIALITSNSCLNGKQSS